MNVGINEQKMGRFGLLVKARHRQISGAVDEGLVLCSVQHHLNTVCGACTLETEHGLCICLETNAAITRGAYKEGNH